MGEQYVCCDGQEQVYKDQDYCKEGYFQGQDIEVLGVVDLRVFCYVEIKYELYLNYLV